MLSRLETRSQEVILLVTLVGCLFIVSGGMFYLILDPKVFSSLLGEYGKQMMDVGLSLFGYAYFGIAISLFVLGKNLIERVQGVEDVVSAAKPMSSLVILQFAFLVFVGSYLTIFEATEWIGSSQRLEYGAGGMLGIIVGGTLDHFFGIFGALSILTCFILVAGICGGVIHLVSLIEKCHSIVTEVFQRILSITKRITDFVLGSNKLNDDMISGAFLQLEMVNSAAGAPIISPININPPATDSSEIKKEKKTKKKQLQSVPNPEEEDNSINDSSSEPEAKESEFHIEIKSYKKRYKKPDSTLLSKAPKAKKLSQKEIKEQCRNLEECLESFQIKGEVIAAYVGPSLTMYEFKPASGVKLSKLNSLSNDLALVLGASSIRVLAPIPGKTTCGIEVPNKTNNVVSFKEVSKSVLTAGKKKGLPIVMGKDVYNNVLISDITEMPHLLVSGTTGSGKSVFINSLITSLLFNRSPKELRFVMIDPKMIELSPYNGIPHLLRPVITDVTEAKESLVWAMKEMDKRYKMFSDVGARNITSFNEKIKANKVKKKGLDILPYIVVVVDEMADLMLTQGKEVEVPITRIAQKARAAGVHLILATQRPSSEIVTGLIKTNFPTRIAFKVSSSIDSRTILDTAGAEKLLGKGDMLFMENGKNIERLQGSFLSEEEVKKVVNLIQSKN